MNDRKPVIIAVAVGSLALAANGAVAVIAISASSAPPDAALFAITGLSAAFVGLIATIIWALRDDPKPASIRHQRVFTPWAERADEEFAALVETSGRSALALARVAAPAPQRTEAPAAGEATVIYIAEWLKTRRVEHASA
ncbi:MAG TPA: hypothetical protein VG328_12510 [Stellaceae bacterium]|jgi:hypothetical protein|nr:hypothetical protein [Stellaceae bacterium]